MEDRLLALLADHHSGVVVALKRDGRPQLSNVSYTFDPDRRLIRVSITEGRAKTKNLRRDPRVSFYVAAPNFRSYVVAEGEAELTPVAAAPDDATVDELIEVYRAVAGEHPDWDEYRAAMVADERLVLRIPVTRVYGIA
ncbi:PPOX class F420-dependent oxidoreductase [Actinophytocola sp.]|uniref:PPOX class F420-dependent oxidoreductase n=1 Tax=Actinophytocola sp. TaxID=1872138 RepID=UPI002D3C6ED4|nr:PPOX class F420-dependent oxidoreductase [Actinophytocola sp.]HYQ62304.1 PPOX class F420-dependent oxidoreductase [Actinophytocola sp.]